MSVKDLSTITFPIWILPPGCTPYKVGNLWYGFDKSTGTELPIGVMGDTFVQSRLRLLTDSNNLFPLRRAYTTIGDLFIDKSLSSFATFIDSRGVVKTLSREQAKFRKIKYYKVYSSWMHGTFRYLYTDLGVYRIMSSAEIYSVGFITIGRIPIPVHFVLRYGSRKLREKVLI